MEKKRLVWTAETDARLIYNPMDCDWMPRPEPLTDDHDRIMLKREHGFIYYDEESRQDNPNYFHAEQRGETIELGEWFYKVFAHSPRWAPYRGAYFFREFEGGVGARAALRRQGSCWTGWWLYPDGRVESECVPTGPWADNALDHLAPYREGYVFGIRTFGTAPGVYAGQSDGGHFKLFGGTPSELKVSPDGCRVAFNHSWRIRSGPDNRPDPYVLRAASLCEPTNQGG